MGNVKKLLGLYAYGMFQKLFTWSMRYMLRPPRIYICKFEPGREAEVVPEDKKVHGLYAYGTFMNPF